MVGGQPAGWHPDPLAPRTEPSRNRWWTGARWSPRVRAPIADASQAEMPEGIAWIPWLDLLAPPPVLTISPVPTTSPVAAVAPIASAIAAPQAVAVFDADPVVMAFGPPDPNSPDPNSPDPTASIGVHWTSPHVGEGHTVAGPPDRTRRHRRRIEALAFAAALVLLVGGAVAGADILSGDQRPTLESAVAYRDTAAGFALRSPADWRVIEHDRGTAIRFAIGAPGAPTTETNTVSVSVGSAAAALPELHTLANQLTERLREDLPDVRLEEAGRASIAGAPGLRFAFVEPGVPETRIEQYVGRTTAGRPLTITVTVREPRTAPTAAELEEFVASVTPA